MGPLCLRICQGHPPATSRYRLLDSKVFGLRQLTDEAGKTDMKAGSPTASSSRNAAGGRRRGDEGDGSHSCSRCLCLSFHVYGSAAVPKCPQRMCALGHEPSLAEFCRGPSPPPPFTAPKPRSTNNVTARSASPYWQQWPPPAATSTFDPWRSEPPMPAPHCAHSNRPLSVVLHSRARCRPHGKRQQHCISRDEGLLVGPFRHFSFSSCFSPGTTIWPRAAGAHTTRILLLLQLVHWHEARLKLQDLAAGRSGPGAYRVQSAKQESKGTCTDRRSAVPGACQSERGHAR